MSKKKLTTNLYFLEDFRYNKEQGWHYEDLNGCLYARHTSGIYKTKLTENDLPDWYVYGRFHKRFGYLSAKNVKQIKLFVFRWDSHLYRDDYLVVSYSETPEITEENKLYGNDFVFVDGNDMFKFLGMVSKYSNIDVLPIIDELIEKAKWYDENHADWIEFDLNKTLERIYSYIEKVKENRQYFIEHALENDDLTDDEKIALVGANEFAKYKSAFEKLAE